MQKIGPNGGESSAVATLTGQAERKRRKKKKDSSFIKPKLCFVKSNMQIINVNAAIIMRQYNVNLYFIKLA